MLVGGLRMGGNPFHLLDRLCIRFRNGERKCQIITRANGLRFERQRRPVMFLGFFAISHEIMRDTQPVVESRRRRPGERAVKIIDRFAVLACRDQRSPYAIQGVVVIRL